MKRFVCYTRFDGRAIADPPWFLLPENIPTRICWLAGDARFRHWRSIGDDDSDKPGWLNSGDRPDGNKRFQTDDVNDLSDAAVAALMKMELLAKEGTD